MSATGGAAATDTAAEAAAGSAEAAGDDGAAQEDAARAAPAPEGADHGVSDPPPADTAATTEKALEEARAFSAAAGDTVGTEETFDKELSLIERLRLEPAHEIKGIKIDVTNVNIIGKLLVYNGETVKGKDTDMVVYEMYPAFAEKPKAYCAPAVRPKITPGDMFSVVKDWIDYKACFFFLARPPGASAVAVLVLEKVPKDGDPPGQHPKFVHELSPMKLLMSEKLEADEEFSRAAAPLVQEWARGKSIGPKGRGDALRAANARAAAERAKEEEAAAAAKAAAKAEAKAQAAKVAAAKVEAAKIEASKVEASKVEASKAEPAKGDDLKKTIGSKKWLKQNITSCYQLTKVCPRKEQLSVACDAMGIKASTAGEMKESLRVALGLVEVVGSSDDDDDDDEAPEPEPKPKGGSDGRGNASEKRGGNESGKTRPPPPPPVESEWTMHLDSASNRPYWSHSATGVTTWQNPHKKPKPPPLAPPPPLETPQQQHAPAMHMVSHASQQQIVSHASSHASSSSSELSGVGGGTGLSPIIRAAGRAGAQISLTINQRGAFEGSTHYHCEGRQQHRGGSGSGGSGGGGGGGGGGAPSWW